MFLHMQVARKHEKKINDDRMKATLKEKSMQLKKELSKYVSSNRDDWLPTAILNVCHHPPSAFA